MQVYSDHDMSKLDNPDGLHITRDKKQPSLFKIINDKGQEVGLGRFTTPDAARVKLVTFLQTPTEKSNKKK